MTRLRTEMPAFVLLMLISAGAMAVPALVATVEADWVSARAFLHGGILIALLSLLVGLATRGARGLGSARAQLLTLLGVYSVLPLLLAIPFHQAIGQGTLGGAWFEMVSAITTTGGSMYDRWWVVPRAAHLWRAEVGWLGGFFTWVVAAAILAPMNLGGFEVRAPASSQRSARAFVQLARFDAPGARLARFAMDLAPVYGGLTAVLWIGLMISGESELVALTHAMSVLATSGISAIGGVEHAQSGLAGEGIMLLFFAFALSRTTFARTLLGDDRVTLRSDPEIRLGLLLIGATTLFLVVRHWFGGANGDQLGGALTALWGTLFTVASFLTTTGFESQAWAQAEAWSGLEHPGLALIGLAIMGGGVATTAGGVKLMRIYALSHLMGREVNVLVLPHSVSGGGQRLRRIREQGAFIAWIFFMLFALSIALVMTLLSLTGVQFETAMVLTVAALANCGPLAQVAAEIPVSFADVPPLSQLVLAAAMVAGRLESLAIIALLNAEIWRK